MPNWCYGNINFYGTKQNVQKLYNDILSALQYDKNQKYWHKVNMWYFLEKTGFSPMAYLDTHDKCIVQKLKERYPDKDDEYINFATYIEELNFRAYFTNCAIIYDEYGMMGINVDLESAWNLDTRLLFLISKKYEVIYEYFCNEPGVGFADKGYYGFVPPSTVENYIVCGYKEGPRWEDDEYIEEKFIDSKSLNERIEQLQKDGYDYNYYSIGLLYNSPMILGMYYEDINTIPGIVYDIEIK